MAKGTYVDKSAEFEALFGMSRDGLNPTLNDASLLHMAGSSGLSGDYQGGGSICELLNRMRELTDNTLHFSLPQVIATNDRIVVLSGHVDAIRWGRRLDSDVIFVLAVKGGSVREMWLHHPEQGQVDEFWAAHQAHG